MVIPVLYLLFLLSIVYQCLAYGYWAVKLRRAPISSAAFPGNVEEQSGVSVVVCVHNERENIAALLSRLKEQRYHPYEIVIADDRSTDGTYEYLTDAPPSGPPVRVLRIEQGPMGIQPKKYALTQAIQAARYDKLLLTDADCRPASSDWLRLMTHPLHGPTQFVLGYSPYGYRSGWLNRFIRFETLHTGFLYIAAAVAGYPYMGVGRNLAYRKLFFLSQGGFHEHQAVVGGDDDLWVNHHATKSNTAVVLNKDALSYSIPKACWSDYYYQKKRHLHVGRYYRPAARLGLGLLSLSTVMVWITGVLLGFLCNEWEVIVILFMLRWFIVAAALDTAGRRLHDPIKLGLLPILDFLHVIYYIVIGTVAFSTKNTRWTN